MSLFHPVNLVCPACKEAITMQAVGSVNADRRPDFRDDILQDRFQDVTCSACGESFRLQPQFNYLDAGRGQWIAALPAGRLRTHLEVEDEVAALFADSYGSHAPKAAQAVGEGLQVRITFGWPAVREKLLIREHALDDTILEMMKMHILRSVPSAPIAEGVELRCVRVGEDAMIFVWLETASEAPIQEISAPRGVYDAIAANPEGWENLRKKLENGAFVDIQKLYMGEGRPAA
jgi:hypothetical protein